MYDTISGTITTSDTTSTTTSDTVAYYKYNYKIECEKCKGSGFQQRNDGIFVICPICEGTGWREQKQKVVTEPRVPYYPYPQYPWYPMPWMDGPTYTAPDQKYIITCSA